MNEELRLAESIKNILRVQEESLDFKDRQAVVLALCEIARQLGRIADVLDTP